MSSFTSPLVVTPLKDGRTWKLVRSFTYHVGNRYSRDVIRVPVGFTTDFASTPPCIWPLFPPWGKYGKAAVVHDYLYWVKLKTRKEADDIFREAMVILGVSRMKVFLMYWAVRLFGWIAWHFH